MELKVIGKRLFTERIDKVITEGEYNADIIGITLERFHDGADLSEYSFRITAYSEGGSTIAEQLLDKDPAGEKTMRLVWRVSPTFAAESGTFTLTLAGVAADNSAQIKFTSSPVRINADGRAEFIPDKTVTEQYLNQVQLEAQKAADAAKRAETAAAQGFKISAATENIIGGILSGGDVSVAESGKVTVNSVGGKKVEADVPADAKFTDTVYTLPTASASILGGVKVDGKTITAKDGVISAVAGSGGGNLSSGGDYVLPPATESSLGGVIVDGTTIIVSENGVISAIAGGGNPPSGGDYVLPPATDSSLGGVIVDGTTITVSENGVISAHLTEDVSSGASADGVTLTESGGVISVKDNSHKHTVENITGLNEILDSKAELSHSHAAEDISGLQGLLDSKADISAIPSSLPANGGNAATVGGFTVGTNVPSNAKFTDTVYTLPKASASVLGGVRVDGTTITANASGIISAAASGGSGITIDKIFEDNIYWTKIPTTEGSDVANILLPNDVTYWDYLFATIIYCESAKPWFGYGGSALIKTSDIVYASKDPSTYQATKANLQYLISKTDITNAGCLQFFDSKHVKVKHYEQVIIWGIKAPSVTSQKMKGTLINRLDT